MKKKRKIKIQKAQFGTNVGLNGVNTVNTPSYFNYSQQFGPNSQIAQNTNMINLKADMLNNDPMAAQNFTNSLKSNQLPSNSLTESVGVTPQENYSNQRGQGGGGFSGMDVGSLSAATTGGIGSIFGYGAESSATTSKEAKTQSSADVSQGASAGASMGSSFGGPLGALIGAGIGQTIGLIGRKGREAEMTSFYTYDEGTLGTGLIGAFSNRKLKKTRDRIKRQAEGNRLALGRSQELAADYAQESDSSTDIFSYANGGVIPNSLVYADDGELIKTPYGDISQVPEQNNPTDSNLLNLPEGSKILSDTLKVPGTKKTFAEAGKKIMNTKKSKYNDKYSENSQKLNDMNNKIAYDNLFALQEEVKKKKGIKPKTKDLVQAAQNGTVVTNSRTGTFSVGGKRYNLGEIFDYKGKQYKVTGTNEATPINTVQNTTGTSNLLNNVLSSIGDWFKENSKTKRRFSAGYNENGFMTEPAFSGEISMGITRPNNKQVDAVTGAAIVNKPITVNKPIRKYENEISISQNLTPVKNKNIVVNDLPPLAPILDEIYPMHEYEYSEQPLQMAPLYRTEKGPQIPKTSSINVTTNPNTGNGTPDNQNNLTSTIGDIATGIAKYVPVISNLMTDHETTDAVYNPYANAILKVARSRKANIQPMLRKIAQNMATSNYNASQVSPNTGAGLAYRLQSAIAANDATTKALAYKNNLDNQYLAEYANMMNDLGKQFVNSTVYADDINRKSRASARNIRRQGLSQLSGIAQNDQLMRNQKNRDDAMMALYAPFLEAGFTKDDLKNLQKYLRKGGNNVG